MLPAQPKYSSGARRAAASCAQTLLQRVPGAVEWHAPTRPREKPTQAVQGRNAGACSMVEHEAQLVLAVKQLKKMKGIRS